MTRRRHSSEFKGGIALEAIRGEMTVAEIAKKYGVHPGRFKAGRRKLWRILRLFLRRVAL